MVRTALLASLGLTLLARVSCDSEIANELSNHYNGYPHTTVNTQANGNAANPQATPQKPQVNSFIPLVFFYQATLPFMSVTPAYGTPLAPAARIITTEQNGGPGDVPTYLFNGKKPAVENNYPSIFPAHAGRKLLQEQSIAETNDFANPVGSHPGCLGTAPTAPLVNITAPRNSPSFENLAVALCSNLKNLTNPNGRTGAGRKLLQNRSLALKMYGEVKKAGDTGFPVLTYVLDFTTRPILELFSKKQPVGAIPAAGTVSFLDCVIYLADGSFVRSAPGTCFDNSEMNNGVPAPVIVRLAAKSFFYGSGTLAVNTGGNAGTQVTPIASFAFNYADTNGAPKKSLIYQTGNGGTSTITQTYGVYIDPSGIYPGQK